MSYYKLQELYSSLDNMRDDLANMERELDTTQKRLDDAEFCLTEMWAAFETAAPEAAKSFCANINIAKRLCDFVEVGDVS